MPGMTGLEMLPKVKEMRPDVPIIMITAYGDPETKRKAIEGGATGLLTKPIDFTLLREEIDARLGPGQLNRPPLPRWFTTSGIGTFETCPPILRMSVHRGRPEVAVIRSNRRE